jgi:hypothetical protein
MWKEYLDLVKQLHEQLERFVDETGRVPGMVILSPSAFQWLVSIFQEDQLVLGVSPINVDNWTYSTTRYTLRIVIDEMSSDYEIRIE